MAVASIGICTPIPMVPIEQAKLEREKIMEAAKKVEFAYRQGTAQRGPAEPESGAYLYDALKLIEQAYQPPKSQDKHLGLITPEWQRARQALVIPAGHAPIEI